MSRSKEKLTKLRVEGYPLPPKGQEFHWDNEDRGFGVGVTPGGARTYVAQARVGDKTVRIKIGTHGRWTCDEARRAARELLLKMDKGIDPRAEDKREKAQAVTLRQVAADYCANKKTKLGPLKARTKLDIENHVAKSFGDWADEPVKNITPDACKKRFTAMSATGPVQANQAFRVLRALLNYARKSSKTDEGVATLLAENPVTIISDKSMWNPEKPKDRRVPPDKVGAVLALLQAERAAGNQTANSRTCADYVTFLLLTGARPGEAKTLTWAQVKLDEGAGSWHLPDPKNRRPITRPLSEPARALLAARQGLRIEDNPYVFPARSRGKHLGQAPSVFKKISAIAGMTLSDHDTRRTFSDAAEEVGLEHKVPQLLGHVASTVTSRHYTNSRDPRKLLPAVDAIASYYEERCAIAMGKNVIALRA